MRKIRLMKIGIFMADSNGGYPVPASRGGAVSTLIEHIVEENEKQQKIDLDIISIYDKKAEEISRGYPKTHFIWIKPPKIVYWLDSLLFYFIKNFFKRKKAVSYKSMFSLIYSIFISAGILKHSNYDKVVLENNIPLAWCIKLSKYKGDYFYHFHNVPRINAKCKDVFNGCKSILCVSQFVADQIASDDNPIGPILSNKLKVLYNCIDTKQFVPLRDFTERDKVRTQFGIKSTDNVVCFVGRLSEEKGIDKVLKAVYELNRKDIKVLIVGSFIHNVEVMDDYYKELCLLADKLDKQVIFTGYISQNEVQKIYQCSDMAVLPSMWDEPAGLTMVEALACGIPIITTDSGGIPEYMQNSAIILKRDENIVMSIAKVILDIIDNKNTINNNNDNNDISRFSTDNYYRKFVELLGDR